MILLFYMINEPPSFLLWKLYTRKYYSWHAPVWYF